MESPICWLASYPKSGNTWVRFLLHQYLFGRAEASEEIATAIPDVHVRHEAGAGREFNGARVWKTHHRLTVRMPHRDRTRSAIYITRHPRSVMLSSLNYFRLIAPPEVARCVEPEGYIRNFIKLGGDPLFIQQGFGSMLEHAGSWLGHPSLERLVVRYEDLRANPGIELARMLHFLGVEPEQDRVERAVEDSSFDRMRAIETAEKDRGVTGPVFAGAPETMGRGLRFMNAATNTKSLDEIAPGLDAMVDERFAWLLDRLGYERTLREPTRTSA